jgi:hypothetical protein
VSLRSEILCSQGVQAFHVVLFFFRISKLLPFCYQFRQKLRFHASVPLPDLSKSESGFFPIRIFPFKASGSDCLAPKNACPKNLD